MRIFLVRHGETAHNRDGLGLGRDDVELTARGLLQADAVASRLAREDVGAVYASPLQRAGVLAARIAAPHRLPIAERRELIELDVGATEGLPFSEIHGRHPEFLAQWRGPDSLSAVMPGGESLADVNGRLAPFLDEIVQLPDMEAVAVVSHNFVIRLAICHLLGVEPRHYRSFIAGLASISVIAVDGSQRSVESLNDTCHLSALES